MNVKFSVKVRIVAGVPRMWLYKSGDTWTVTMAANQALMCIPQMGLLYDIPAKEIKALIASANTQVEEEKAKAKAKALANYTAYPLPTKSQIH